jgi:hypothetical protein
MTTGIKAALLAVAASAALVACGGGGDSGVAPAPAAGTLRVALTDAPACGFEAVNVTVARVRVHQSSTANDGDGGWYDVPVVNGPRKIDLLTLTNGVLLDLGQTTLPAGKYEQIRLVLASNKSTPKANTVTPKEGEETEMDTPSAAQSGLKLINGFTVAPNTMTDIVLDFDACKSVVKRGNGSYGLKPVITMIPRTLTAIVGYVETGLTDITVTAQNGGVVAKATQPNPTTGQFVLGPLNQNTYDVVITGKDRTTAVIAAVGVQPDQVTTLNSSVQPIDMPSSGSGAVRGKLTLTPPATTMDGAEVRGLQPVGAVPLMVEIAYTMTLDATTGAYELSLPVAAPRLATWSGTMISPALLLDQVANAAKYKLEASAPGYNTSALKDVTVSATTPQTDQDFTLTLKP